MKRTVSAVLAAFIALCLPGAGLSEEAYILLKGDLHCHSSFSHDSDVKAEQVISDSVTAGYDFIALTEHNTLRHLKEDHSTEDLIVLPGYELTLQSGHYNVFGLRDFAQRASMAKAELVTYLASLKEQGALIQVDHPNDAKYYSRYGYEMDVDMIEVFNGAVREDDLKTLDEYQALLAEGRKVILTGGTDAHKNHTQRLEFNCVLATEKTSEAILEAIAAGRLYVTMGADGPALSLTCGEAVMGATVSAATDSEVIVEATGLLPGSVVKIYGDAGMVRESATVASDTVTVSLKPEGMKFVRAEVWSAAGEVLAASNPIYFE